MESKRCFSWFNWRTGSFLNFAQDDLLELCVKMVWVGFFELSPLQTSNGKIMQVFSFSSFKGTLCIYYTCIYIYVYMLTWAKQCER